MQKMKVYTEDGGYTKPVKKYRACMEMSINGYTVG